MTWLKVVWSEVFGLFVDDGPFALTILIWLAAVGLILPHLNGPGFLPPIILFVGLAAILAQSVMAAAHREGRR